jgi:HlyD family secretion protein
VSEIRKSPQVVENVVAYKVVLTAPNKELTLLPGMTAMVHVVVDRVANVLKIPNAALRFRPQTANPPSAEAGTAIVWVKGFASIPEPVQVKLGSSDSSSTELVGGSLHVGDSVMIGTTPTAGPSPWLGIRWGS